MLQNIRIIIAIALVAGIIWNCGSERVTQSEIGTEEQIGRPLSKLASQQNAIVIATVQQNDAPVSGAKVEFARSIAGQKADYQWSDMTDENGQARIEITAGNGYYQARASQDGIEIGSWSSIPINEGDIERAGAAAEGAISFTAWTSTADTPGNRAFVENYTMRASVEPNAFTAQSYATVHILANAIANAQSIDSRAIRDALAKTRDLDTILGKFSFDANGDGIYNPVILIVRNGKLEVFEP